MLLNNFKPLLQFYPDSTFVNVLGNTVSKSAVMPGQINASILNGHSWYASNLTYNYNAATGTNGYTNEQRTYSWIGAAGQYSESDNYRKFNGFTIFIGSGYTPAAPEDYKLENALELGVIAASCFHYANGKTIVSRSFYNNTGEYVTIREIGCYIFVNSNPNQPIVMIGRKVLPSPVIIPDGQQYTFTYTIDTSRVSFEEADS